MLKKEFWRYSYKNRKKSEDVAVNTEFWGKKFWKKYFEEKKVAKKI